MRAGKWTQWPTREALSRIGVPRARMALDIALLAALSTWAVASAYSSDVFRGWGAALPPLALIAVFAAVGWGACLVGATVAAVVLWIGACVMSMERLPLAVALAVVAVIMPRFALVDDSDWGAGLTLASVSLGGYALRLDAEARGAGFRLLAQERAAREAEAVSAALAERARIAREIHDVLAHSLSAQLVHLEAARLQIERGPEGAFRDQILERVVAARGMAREGLAETRQALSALRGEMTPVEDYLRELAANDGARTEVSGERRQLPAEASQAVRRVAQEALTNVRKHAPGAEVRLVLGYLTDEVSLEIRDFGGRGKAGDLTVSGAGYGLLGMRERAELLGGTLEAGPEGKGFAVRLRVPA
ncbi:sensor histidine kinase [Streptomyces xantholiticus]|uniref:sensor histidine kinase n=1 Tax=Streptomyces xantholiticus TaxID=68285 RepID=UPI001994CF2B|nr:sensor histidine kinase [Streptomyces xantholiticus]GGW50695.1 two-component sensor histidine kinase [Streptomyces xantholiticus]